MMVIAPATSQANHTNALACARADIAPRTCTHHLLQRMVLQRSSHQPRRMIMFKMPSLPTPRSVLAVSATAGAAIAVVLAILGGRAISAQDKYTVQVPNGLAFSEFRGYENWEYVAVSQTENGIKVIAANPTMMDAYRDGVPGNGKHFPEGSKIVKIEW